MSKDILEDHAELYILKQVHSCVIIHDKTLSRVAYITIRRCMGELHESTKNMIKV